MHLFANELKNKYYNDAMQHLEDIAVLSSRKAELIKLAQMLIQREY
jgi:geranylgeranyl diphosphate synthase, type II